MIMEIDELSLQPGEVQVWVLDRDVLGELSQRASATLSSSWRICP